MIDAILANKPCRERSFWLDRGRRECRLRRDDNHVVAEHRDGRSFRLPWPADDPVFDSPGFAEAIFNICLKTAAAD